MPDPNATNSIVVATSSYESWLASHTPIVTADLDRKHDKMDRSPFTFMRATFYRWAATFPEVCPELASAPTVLAVGDMHVNNFGVWRDVEGRLAWGVNDFDEAFRLPYTNDLVRLALSAALTAEEADLAVCLEHACEAIIDGYVTGLRKGGKAFVLAERNDWIRDLAVDRLVHPDRFWAKIKKLPDPTGEVPEGARLALEAMLPEPAMPYRVAARTAGAGSLGRPRYVAIGDFSGGRIAREAKAIVPSACVWCGFEGGSGVHYDDVFANSVRVRDPWSLPQGDWMVRRLAPDCTRIELDSLPKKESAQTKLLKAMGREVANVHLGSDSAPDAVLEDITSRKASWLRKGAGRMLESLNADWDEWKARG